MMERHLFSLDGSFAQGGNEIPAGLYGFNTEITRRGCWQGLAAEMVANRKFAAIGKDGFASRWLAAGSGSAAKVDITGGYAGRHSVIIENHSEKRFAGIAQEEPGLQFSSGKAYRIRLTVRGTSPQKIELRLARQGKAEILWKTDWTITPGDWQTLTAEVPAGTLSGAGRLEIGSAESGRFAVGAVSLLPADAFFGMRRDVVDQLKALRPGGLRFPGGCYAEFYEWRDALLPVDQRPPIGPTGLPFLLPEGDDFDNHEIGVNEFLELCREVGAEPAITIRMNESSPEEAAALVQYCNRADTPCRVPVWFLGNELYTFGHGGLERAEICAERTAEFARAVLAVDPSLTLVGCSFYDLWDWNDPMAEKAGTLLNGYSFHYYLLDHFSGRLDRVARATDTHLEPMMRRVRDGYTARLPGKKFEIVFDEWNLRWGSSGTVGMGVYAAEVLQMLTQKSEVLGVRRGYFFMAINEGIIKVLSDGAELDAAGIIFDLFRPHGGRRLLNVSGEKTELCAASQGASADELWITLLNRNVGADAEFTLDLPDVWHGKSFTAKLWIPVLPDLNASGWIVETRSVAAQNGKLSIVLPPGAVAGLGIQQK